jgi:CubicO group peptidase (beta-lactamase class C family)
MGKISLDDDVRKYVPELRKHENLITIRHLVHHTSGIRDYLTLAEVAALPDEHFYTPEDTIELLGRQKKLNFLPGEEHYYSNSGYFLLGVIVERVSGKSLNNFAQEHIFARLGMKNTHFHDDHTAVVKNRAAGYAPTEDGYRIDMTTLDHVGDGGVFTTVEDLYLWDQAFYTSQLEKEIMNLIQTPGVLNDGKKLDYAFGLVIDEYRGLKRVSHDGGFVGFRAQLTRFPRQKFSIVCLANLGIINSSRLCLQVADIYLADEFEEESPEEEVETVSLTKEELEKRVGRYHDKTRGVWATMSAKEDHLQVAVIGMKFGLAPVSRTRFRALDAAYDVLVDFLSDEKAKLHLDGEDYELTRAPQIEPLTTCQLLDYVGEYYNEELPVTYRLAVEENALFFKHKNAPSEALELVGGDEFTVEIFNIAFVRDDKEKITGFVLGAGRAPNIEFKR